MRMVQYVIQVQQLGLRVGAQKNRLNGIEVILFEYLLCISGFRRKVFIIPAFFFRKKGILIFIPAFFFRKKGYINFVSKSVRRPSVRPSVCPSVRAYVRPSRFL